MDSTAKLYHTWMPKGDTVLCKILWFADSFFNPMTHCILQDLSAAKFPLNFTMTHLPLSKICRAHSRTKCKGGFPGDDWLSPSSNKATRLPSLIFEEVKECIATSLHPDLLMSSSVYRKRNQQHISEFICPSYACIVSFLEGPWTTLAL